MALVSELISKIIGFNAHVTVKPYDKAINSKNLKNNNLINISKNLIFTNSGESVLINKDFTKGIILRGYERNDFKKRILPFCIMEQI